MAYTWATFKNLVKTFLTDEPLTDDGAYIAVADYVRAKASRDLLGDLPNYGSSWGSWIARRRDMLGYSITANDSTLKVEVRKLLTEAGINDNTAIRSVVTYLRAYLALDVERNLPVHETLLKDWQIQRARLLGYTVSISGNTLRTEINKLLSDFSPINDDAAVRAIADYVKGRIASEVNNDPDSYTMYNARWLEQKARLLGYTCTLSDANLRTAINKLITVDSTRVGIAEAGGFIDTVMLQAKADIAAVNTLIDTLIVQATNDLAGMATFVDTNILKAKAELASTATRLDNLIRQGVIELEEMVPFYRTRHESIFQPDDLTDDGEASAGNMPEDAQIQEAYYLRSGDQVVSRPFTNYSWENRSDLVMGAPKMQRYNPFYLAISPDSKQFVVFPAVLEGNYVSVIWNGLKIVFADGDTVPFEESDAKVIADYVQKERYAEPATKDLQLAKVHMANYLSGRTSLYRQALDRTRIKDSPDSPAQSRCCPVRATNDDVVEFVAVGDSGESPLDNTAAVAALALSQGGDFMLHLGDTNYPSADPVNFQDYLVAYYSSMFLQGTAPDHPTWYQAWGNHDLASSDDGQWGKPLLDLLPYIAGLNGGKLYYPFTRGPLNFFIYNSGYSDAETREPDGIGVGSIQAAWLEEKLGEADSGFNIVVMHRPPWTSDTNYTPGSPVLQTLAASLKGWGADLIVSGHGHNYERGVLTDGLPWLVCGLGGATKRAFGATTTGSQFRYTAKYGVLRFTATTKRLQVSFINTDRERIDGLTIDHA